MHDRKSPFDDKNRSFGKIRGRNNIFWCTTNHLRTSLEWNLILFVALTFHEKKMKNFQIQEISVKKKEKELKWYGHKKEFFVNT